MVVNEEFGFPKSGGVITVICTISLYMAKGQKTAPLVGHVKNDRTFTDINRARQSVFHDTRFQDKIRMTRRALYKSLIRQLEREQKQSPELPVNSKPEHVTVAQRALAAKGRAVDARTMARNKTYGDAPTRFEHAGAQQVAADAVGLSKGAMGTDDVEITNEEFDISEIMGDEAPRSGDLWTANDGKVYIRDFAHRFNISSSDVLSVAKRLYPRVYTHVANKIAKREHCDAIMKELTNGK